MTFVLPEGVPLPTFAQSFTWNGLFQAFYGHSLGNWWCIMTICNVSATFRMLPISALSIQLIRHSSDYGCHTWYNDRALLSGIWPTNVALLDFLVPIPDPLPIDLSPFSWPLITFYINDQSLCNVGMWSKKEGNIWFNAMTDITVLLWLFILVGCTEKSINLFFVSYLVVGTTIL